MCRQFKQNIFPDIHFYSKGEVDLENTFYKMCIIFMETFTKTVVVHHGLRQLNKVKYPTNQGEYRLLIDSSNKF